MGISSLAACHISHFDCNIDYLRCGEYFFSLSLSTYPKRERVVMTERVVDVAAGSVGGRSTVDLIVSQRCQCFTLSHTESYVKVHQSTAALQISTLCTIRAQRTHPSTSLCRNRIEKC